MKRALSAPSALRLVKDGLILEAQLTLPTHFFSFVLKLTLKVHSQWVRIRETTQMSRLRTAPAAF